MTLDAFKSTLLLLRGAHGHWFRARGARGQHRRLTVTSALVPVSERGLPSGFPFCLGSGAHQAGIERPAQRRAARSRRRRDRSPLTGAGPPVTPLPPSWWRRSSPPTSEPKRGARLPRLVPRGHRPLHVCHPVLAVALCGRSSWLSSDAGSGRPGASGGRAHGRDRRAGRGHRPRAPPSPALRPTPLGVGAAGGDGRPPHQRP